MVVELAGPDQIVGLVVDAVTEPSPTERLAGVEIGFLHAVAKVDERLVLILELAELLDKREQGVLPQAQFQG